MKRSDFHYDLPQELIAQAPLAERSASRMLIVDGQRHVDATVADLADALGPDDLMVFNDTRVIPARLHGQKDSGGRVEILVERVRDEFTLLAQVRSSKTPKAGRKILVGDASLTVLGREGEFFLLDARPARAADLVEQHGEMPLPPYIDRAADAADRERYQTVYARAPGAVAAPTAGLHFDDALLRRIDDRGVRKAWVTLHVGAGTFQPVRSETLAGHRMHSEWTQVDASVCEAVAETRARGGRVVAVGTTSVRALESAAASGELKPYCDDTRLFITPGYEFRVVDALFTNFHLPESTLLMLVSAFAGYDVTMSAYRHAVRMRYRFFSYGDAMWLPNRGKAKTHG